MYGYIKPNIPELKVKEKQRYDAWYCGLCRALGKRYGQTARLLLSYDTAFLAMLLSSAFGEASPCEKHICPVRPLGKKKPMVRCESPALDYAADICVILAKFKIEDDVRDGKKLRAAANVPFFRAFHKAKRNAPEVYSCVKSGIEKLTVIEMERERSPELAANTFGGMLREIMKNAPIGESFDNDGTEAEKLRAVLAELGFFIGRTIYLIDAWDDREDDKKHGLYNPFNLGETTREEAEFIVSFSINSAISAYNLLERCGKSACAADLPITQNVLFEGLFAAWDAVLNKKNTKLKTKERLEEVE